jgi:hypothetical protein
MQARVIGPRAGGARSRSAAGNFVQYLAATMGRWEVRRGPELVEHKCIGSTDPDVAGSPPRRWFKEVRSKRPISVMRGICAIAWIANCVVKIEP